jgi:hypothetical protein
MKRVSDKIYVVAYVNDDTYNYINEQSKNLSFTKSAFINYCIHYYRNQVSAIDTLTRIVEDLNKKIG